MSYSHEHLAVDIEDHPLAKTLPKRTEVPSIQSGPQNFRAFAAREDAPSKFEDFIHSDSPLISLHVTSFNDATLVALAWPHLLMDVMGQQALLRNWSLFLAGRESEVEPVLGAREDAICAAADAPVEKEEEFKLGQKQLKGLAMLSFGARFAWDLLWNRIVETHTIFLPNTAVAELQRQAQRDLTTEHGSEEKSFISEGDVLTAWISRAVASSLPQPRPITILHALNVRLRLPCFIQASGVYIQNMAVAAFTFLPADTASRSLGDIALENRRHLVEQASEAQVLAGLRELRRNYKSYDDAPMMCGESEALLLPFTNWTKADLFKMVDFSGAVVRAGEVSPSRINPPGTMVSHHASSMQQSITARNVTVVLGKDHGGNYWLTGSYLPAAWAKIRENIDKM